MKKVVHRASERGAANHGWLKSSHSFSFSSYYNPNKMGFGLLRVLNDDIVQGGTGFGTHSHQNMEIVSIPLSGALEHKDSTGRHAVIRAGEVQIMSAGSGIAHSEYNHSKTEEVNFLQIWVLPKKENIAPRYEQKDFSEKERQNQFQTVVSPNEADGGVWINQDAYFSLGDFDGKNPIQYQLKNRTNGVYLFVIDGELEVADETLSKRDALGIWEAEQLEMRPKSNTKLLLMEIPMN